MLLDVIGASSATTAQSVRLVVLLSETRRSLRHLDERFYQNIYLNKLSVGV